MAISRQRKEDLVAQYSDLIERSSAVFFADYTGLSVKQLDEFRTRAIKAGGAFHITKNTLLRRALSDAGQDVPAELLTGQLATGFAMDEIPGLAKVFEEYAKEEDAFELRGGLLQGNPFGPDDIEAITKLPTRDELRAKILALLTTPARNVATILNAPARDFVSVMSNGSNQLLNVINAYAQKQDGEA